MTTQKTPNTLIIKGVNVVRAYFGTTKFNSEPKYHITVNGDIPYDSITAYDNAGTKLTPTWYKNKDGYMNVASKFEIPVQDIKGKFIDFEDWIEEYNAIGAIVNIKIIQKDGAIYPVAIVVVKDGEEINPFEGMERE